MLPKHISTVTCALPTQTFAACYATLFGLDLEVVEKIDNDNKESGLVVDAMSRSVYLKNKDLKDRLAPDSVYIAFVGEDERRKTILVDTRDGIRIHDPLSHFGPKFESLGDVSDRLLHLVGVLPFSTPIAASQPR